MNYNRLRRGRSSQAAAGDRWKLSESASRANLRRLDSILRGSHECADLRVNTMQLETKFLRLRTPVTLGSRFGDWHVTWLGGWSKYRLFYLVMVVKIKPRAEICLARGGERKASGN